MPWFAEEGIHRVHLYCYSLEPTATRRYHASNCAAALYNSSGVQQLSGGSGFALDTVTVTAAAWFQARALLQARGYPRHVERQQRQSAPRGIARGGCRKRLLKEASNSGMYAIPAHHAGCIAAGPKTIAGDGSIDTTWEAVMTGPEGTPYEVSSALSESRERERALWK